jgi:hypothetical protein
MSYKYDVAFSFLADDEKLARDIASLLPNRSVFIFSEVQEMIAGTDGIETFSDVFGRDARIVVVLYRGAWGGTKWTRIEETAIKGRLFNDGAEFLTFVHLEPSKPTPRWLPVQRLWSAIDRLGVAGAAAVIEERLRAAGGTVREETAVDAAARLRREQEAEAKRLGFLNSDRGVREAQLAADRVLDELDRLAPLTGLARVRVPNSLVSLFRSGFCVLAEWSAAYINTLDDSAFIVREWRGRPNVGGHTYDNLRTPQELATHRFHFDVVDDATGWRSATAGRTFTSEKLAEWCVKLLLERIRLESSRQRE